jgi:hypothetical protein
MDPTNQQPGQPTPPWGADPQPEAPQPGQPASPWAPPAQPAPPWGAPVEPAAPWAPAPPPEPPQPGQPTPPWAPADQPAPWGAPGQPGAPQPYYVPGQPWPAMPQKSGRRGKRIAISTIAALVVIIAIVAFNVIRSSVPNAGKVMFSTDLPTTASQGCAINHQVTSIGATTSVYATYIFTDKQGSNPVSLSVTKDGNAYIGPAELDTTDTSGYDCTADTSDLSTLPEWGPGTYDFTATSGGKTVSEGKLTVTP